MVGFYLLIGGLLTLLDWIGLKSMSPGTVEIFSMTNLLIAFAGYEIIEVLNKINKNISKLTECKEVTKAEKTEKVENAESTELNK